MANENSLSLIQSLYVAYYGRPADPEGLAFWADTLELNNGNIQAILGDFGNSAEYVQRFGSMDDTTLVNNLYQQLFGRDAEPEGFGFWTGLLVNNQLSLAQIAHSILDGAQSVDRQVVEGRIQAATAFTQQLDTAEENAAYGTANGIQIGMDFLQQITASNGAAPVIADVVDVVATLLPSTPAPTPGGGGGGTTQPPAPTFEVNIDHHGVLSFAGTQTGPITVTLNGVSDATFARGALTETRIVAEYLSVTEVSIGSASVTTPAIAVSGLIVTGTGSLRLTDVDDGHGLFSNALNLSGIDTELQVTVEVNQDLNITQANDLESVDTFDLAAEVTLTLNVMQKANFTVIGAGGYELQDTVDELAAADSADLEGASRVVVTGEATIEKLEAILNKTSAPLDYSTVRAPVADLTKPANSGLISGKNVVVTHEANVAQLIEIDGISDGGTVTAQNIIDSVATLITGISFITDGTKVTVTDAATVEQIETLDDANGDGELVYSLSDSADSLLANSALIAGATHIEVTDAATIAQLTSIDAAPGTFSYSAVKGTASELIADAEGDGYVTNGKNVVVTGTATITELAALEGAITSAIGAGSVTAANIADDVGSLVTNGIASTYITVGTNVTVKDAATVQQIGILDAANGTGSASGTLVYTLTDSLAHLLAANDDLVASATSITLSGGLTLGNVSVAELVKVLSWSKLDDSGVTHTGLIYNLVDTAANLIAGGDVDAYVGHAAAVTANAPASVYEATALYALNHAASYNITDNAANLAATANASVDAINHGGALIATSPATAAQAKVIHDRTNSGDTTYSVTDTYANLTNGTYKGSIDAAQHLTVTTSPLSAAQATAIQAFSNNGLTTLYQIQDTATAINTFVSTYAWSDDLHYDFYVRDSASAIIAALASGTSFVTGNSTVPADDPSVKQIYVTSTFNLVDAETFWEAVEPTFSSAGTTTAAKTYYQISDTIANYISDETSGSSSAITTWVQDADRKVVNGNAADIEAAQDAGRLIFGELDGNDSIIATGSPGDQTLLGSAGSDTMDGGDGNDVIYGNDGNDTMDGGAGNDLIYGNNGNDTIIGGAGFDRLYGGDGQDTIYAGTNAGANTTNTGLENTYDRNYVTGGKGGDNLFGSEYRDTFIYTATNSADLIAEAGKDTNTRDYITNFSKGDIIQFASNANIQFLGNGSANASNVAAGEFGLSIRYNKGVDAQLWSSDDTNDSTLVSIDIAKADGSFDNVADVVIVLVGNNIDINAIDNAIYFGG